MTVKELKYFVAANRIEVHFHGAIEHSYMFIDFRLLEEFKELLGDFEPEDAPNCYMCDGYFGFPLQELLEGFLENQDDEDFDMEEYIKSLER